MKNAMQQLKEFLKIFYIPTFNFSDLIEILIIIYVIYKLISTLKNTRAWIVLKGILMLCIFYLIAYVCHFDIIKVVFQSAITVFIIAIVIIFQQDLRKLLEQIGNKSLIPYIKDFRKIASSKEQRPKRMSDRTIDELVNAVFNLGKAKTGSLIVIEKDIPLDNIISTGISLNSEISSALLINIFEKNTPLHDGAVVIKNDKIVSATCYLPLSTNTEISKSLGTRHRAGIGATESVDCFVLISSEETGAVSYVENGKITRNVTPEKLKKALQEIQEYPQTLISVKKEKGLNNNTKIKIFSAFLGVLFWIIAMATIDPITTLEFEDIPITVLNESAITSIDKTYDLGGIDSVTIVVEDKRSILDNLSEKDFKATIDLSRLSYVNTVDVNVTVNNQTTEIKKIDNDVIKVNLDDISYAEFPIEVNTINSPPEGFAIKDIVLANETVTITGAETLITKIDKIVAEFDMSKVVDGREITFNPKVFDRNGDIINNNQLDFNNNPFSATITLQPTKKIPLKINIADAEGSAGQIKDISYETTEISIAGENEILDEIDMLEITLPVKIEISDSDNTKLTKVINLSDYLPEGIVLGMEDPRITINITYEPYHTKELRIPTNLITITGGKANFEYKFEQQIIPVTVTASENVLDNLTQADLRLVVDVSAIDSAGTYPVIINISSDKNVILNNIESQIIVTEKEVVEEES